MDRESLRHRGRGFVPLEMLAVVCIIGILLGLGVVVVNSARRQAHLAQGEGRLKHVALALDLYYRHKGRYPPAGSDLSDALGPFVQNPEVFENPLKDEATPGETVSSMYHEPTLQELDAPENYLTAMTGDDGKTIVILKTLGKIDTTADGHYNPDDYIGSKASARTIVEMEKQEPEPEVEPEPDPEPGDLSEEEHLGHGVVVQYYIEHESQQKTGAVVRFEAEGQQLGDGHGQEMDRFTLEVDFDEGIDILDVLVNIQLKAGTQTFVPPADVDTIGEFADPVDLIDENDLGEANAPSSGWSVSVDLDANCVEITFDVEADGHQPHGLSNVEFQFPNGDVEIIEVRPVRRFD